MSIARSMRKVQKVVGILTDPHPEFVSLVNFPANQTPFKSVKFDPARAEDHSAALAKKAASAVIDIASVTFTKKLFKTVDAVRTYMDENGYSNYEIVEQDEAFYIPGHAAEDFEEGTKSIQVEKGVTMMVGRLRPARKSADPVPSTKADEPVTAIKSLWTVSDFAQVLSGVAYLVSDSTYEREYEGDDSTIPEELKAWLASGAEIFKKMAAEEVNELIEKVTAMKAAKEEEAAVLEPASKAASPIDSKTTPVAKPGTAPTAVKPAATAEVAPGTEPPRDEAVSTETPDPKETDTGTTEPPTDVTEAISAPEEIEEEQQETPETAAKAGVDMAALADIMGKQFAEALSPINAKLTELAEASTKSGERIEALEAGARQTRKSAEHEDVGAPSTRSADTADIRKKNDEFRKRQQHNAIGI